jgi:translation initiation factor IF-2
VLQGLNVSLYWKNPDPRKYVNVVPTSAITGEGIPDLLQLMVKLTQSMMQDRLTLLSETQCTVGWRFEVLCYLVLWFGGVAGRTLICCS